MDLTTGTDDSRSQICLVITWLLFVVSVFGVCARLGTKYAMIRKLSWDDGLVLMALAISLAQCIAVSIAGSNGLGKASASLTKESINTVVKAEYASVPFLVLAFALVKWSISVAINYLSPDTLHRRVNTGLAVVVLLWIVPVIFTSVFQCAPPALWDFVNGTRCLNRRAWWAFVAVVNVITDLGIVVLYFMIMWNLQISPSRKAMLISVFSARLLVVVAAITQLTAFWTTFKNSDVTSSLWLPVVLDQAVLCLSITTACLPYLRPFMESLESGIVRVEDIPGSEEELSHDRTGSSGYNLSSLTYTVSSSQTDRCPR